MDVQKIMRNMQSHHFDVSYFETKEEAAAYLCANIQNTTVGMGGSMTLEQLGLYERLAQNNQVAWHWRDKAPDVFQREMAAKVFLSSANAIAETGEVVNIDGRGNRIGSIAFAENKRIYIVAGLNKVCEDVDKAIWRARNVAAPLNAKRLYPNGPNPCVKADRCMDCRVQTRVCGAMLILYEKMRGCEKCEIVLVNEALGF